MAERRRNEKLIHIRLEAGHTQQSLARELQVNAKSVGRWETDFVVPHPDIQTKVATVLGTTREKLGFKDRPLRKLKPKVQNNTALSPHPLPGCQYVVNMTYEQAVSHGIISFEDTIQGSHEERGEQEDDMDKRQFLEQGKNIIIGGVGASIIGDTPLLGQSVVVPTEEFLPQCSLSLQACWKFMDAGNLGFTEQIVAANIPTLLSLTISPSKHQQTAAGLASQAKIMQAILAGLHSNITQREIACKEAIKWSRLSGDITIMAAALAQLGMTYTYFSPLKPEQGIDTFTEALRILGNTPSILISVIHVGLADAYAQCANEQKALRSLAIAKDLFPEYPERDPNFSLADCSLGSLKDRMGRALNNLALKVEKREYYLQAETILDEGLALDRVPRGRIDALLYSTNAALGVGNLDSYVTHVKETVLLAKFIGSEEHYNDTQLIRGNIPVEWRHEQAIRNLDGVFETAHKALFSPETV